MHSIKYFKEDLAQLALLLHSLISSGWNIILAFCGCKFPAGFGGQRPWWLACTRNGGVWEQRRGGLQRFPQSGKLEFYHVHVTAMFIHYTDLGLLFVTQARKRKGGCGGQRLLVLSDRCLSASVTATKAAELEMLPRWSYQPRATCGRGDHAFSRGSQPKPRSGCRGEAEHSEKEDSGLSRRRGSQAGPSSRPGPPDMRMGSSYGKRPQDLVTLMPGP